MVRHAAYGPFREDGARIQALRERLGFDRRQFAFMLGTSEPTVWRWEFGYARPEGASAALLGALRQRVPQLPAAKKEDLAKAIGSVAIGAAVGVALLVVIEALFSGKK